MTAGGIVSGFIRKEKYNLPHRKQGLGRRAPRERETHISQVFDDETACQPVSGRNGAHQPCSKGNRNHTVFPKGHEGVQVRRKGVTKRVRLVICLSTFGYDMLASS